MYIFQNSGKLQKNKANRIKMDPIHGSLRARNIDFVHSPTFMFAKVSFAEESVANVFALNVLLLAESHRKLASVLSSVCTCARELYTFL